MVCGRVDTAAATVAVCLCSECMSIWSTEDVDDDNTDVYEVIPPAYCGELRHYWPCPMMKTKM